MSIDNLKNILIVRGAFGDMYEPAWFRALIDLGHKVNLFDCHLKISSNIFGRIQRRILWGPDINKIRRDLIDYVKDNRPEFTLLYQGHYFDKKTVNKLSNYTFVVGYHNDNPFGAGKYLMRYRHLHKALEAYDGFHVYRPSNVNDILSAGVKNVSVLMPGFMPWMDYPRADDINHLKCEVLFAGHCEKDMRVDCFEKLVNSKINLKVYGDRISWRNSIKADLLVKLGSISHITGDDYRLAISNADICLCFFSKVNIDVYTRRVFEITACKCFLLCERTPEMVNIFPEGEAAEYFDSPEEMLEKVIFYLNNPDLRKKIAATGYQIAHSFRHDIYSRMIKWVEDISRWKADKLLNNSSEFTK